MHPKAKPNGTFQLAKNSREVFVLRIRDESSNVTLLEAEINPLDLINAMTGRADLPIAFELASPEALARVGKVATFRSVGIDKNEVSRRTAGWQHAPLSHPHRAAQEAEFNAWTLKTALAAVKAEDGLAFRPGWLLRSTGIDRQQTGTLHECQLIRYDDPTPDPSTDEPNQH